MEAQDNSWIEPLTWPEKNNQLWILMLKFSRTSHPEDTDQFEDLEHNNPARLHVITRELDDLHKRIQAEEGWPTESLHHIEQELQWLSILLNPPTHTEPLGEVLKHYTKTLCLAQKQTNFANSLLQDISIFTGHDTTPLEDWLIDIKTAADLTFESRTNLAQATSKCLTHTLITEAITSGKSWEDIKVLQLKICNSNIHTSISNKYNKKRKNPSPHTSTILREKLKDVILPVMLPP